MEIKTLSRADYEAAYAEIDADTAPRPDADLVSMADPEGKRLAAGRYDRWPLADRMLLGLDVQRGLSDALYSLYLESTSKWDDAEDRLMVHSSFQSVLAEFKALALDGEAGSRDLHRDIESHLGPRYGYDRASQSIYHRLIVPCAAGGEHRRGTQGGTHDARAD